MGKNYTEIEQINAIEKFKFLAEKEGLSFSERFNLIAKVFNNTNVHEFSDLDCTAICD